MKFEQLSIFIENRAGRLAEMFEVLDHYNIAIRALSLADTANFGVLRIVTDEPRRAEAALKAENITVTLTNIILVQLERDGHGLPGILRVLAESNIEVEYMYAFMHNSNGSEYIILRVEQEEAAVNVLKTAGYEIINN